MDGEDVAVWRVFKNGQLAINGRDCTEDRKVCNLEMMLAKAERAKSKGSSMPDAGGIGGERRGRRVDTPSMGGRSDHGRKCIGVEREWTEWWKT
jgi:hypothetical protein